jgi:S-adenosylmethionine-dependent methyltransferase
MLMRVIHGRSDLGDCAPQDADSAVDPVSESTAPSDSPVEESADVLGSPVAEGADAPASPLVENADPQPYRVPSHLSRNHRQVDEAGLAELRKSIEDNFHVGWRAKESFSEDQYERDVNAHLSERLENDRNRVVPWLDTLRPIGGLRILEIGCGTGSSTIALAEQGAVVVGIDIDEGALQVARDRSRIYDCSVDIRAMNATQLDGEFRPGEFNLIIFFASLEHMTVSERLVALSRAWDILPVGGMLGVIETPNRLWFYDGHTSLLPFFQWLPDDLAFQYSRFSPRDNFRETYREETPASFEHFLRMGRGVSFHEFDLAIQPVSGLNIQVPLSAFLEQNGLRQPTAEDVTFMAFLRQQSPAVPAPLFEAKLNFVIKKER